jgi:hypothetical protein
MRKSSVFQKDSKIFSRPLIHTTGDILGLMKKLCISLLIGFILLVLPGANGQNASKSYSVSQKTIIRQLGTFRQHDIRISYPVLTGPQPQLKLIINRFMTTP